jgi:hypothetical protein
MYWIKSIGAGDFMWCLSLKPIWGFLIRHIFQVKLPTRKRCRDGTWKPSVARSQGGWYPFVNEPNCADCNLTFESTIGTLFMWFICQVTRQEIKHLSVQVHLWGPCAEGIPSQDIWHLRSLAICLVAKDKAGIIANFGCKHLKMSEDPSSEARDWCTMALGFIHLTCGASQLYDGLWLRLTFLPLDPLKTIALVPGLWTWLARESSWVNLYFHPMPTHLEKGIYLHERYERVELSNLNINIMWATQK